MVIVFIHSTPLHIIVLAQYPMKIPLNPNLGE